MMENPVYIIIPSLYEKDTRLSHKVPANAYYKICYAECNCWQHELFTVMEQYYDGKDVFICLAEVRVEIDLDIPILCRRPDSYWLYQLKGAYTVTTAAKNKRPILKMQTDQYRIVYMPHGSFVTHFKKGRHLLFYFVIKSEWLLRHAEEGLESLQSILTKLRLAAEETTTTKALPLAATHKRHIIQLLRLPKLLAVEQDCKVYDKAIALLLQSLADLGEKLKQPPSQFKEVIDQVRIFILQSVGSRPLPAIPELAEQFQVSRFFIWRYHQTYYGSSLRTFIHKVKMDYAYRQLRESTMSIREISFRLGYSEIANFSNLFTKYFGQSPSEVRQSID